MIVMKTRIFSLKKHFLTLNTALETMYMKNLKGITYNYTYIQYCANVLGRFFGSYKNAWDVLG